MEKITFKNSRDLKLVGNFYSAGDEAMVIMCHGFASDQYANDRFGKLAQALNERGISALSFDFSGCGESDDDTLTADKLSDDLISAVDYVKTLGYKKIALFSHSLGAYISLRTYSEIIRTMVLLGPLTGPLDFRADEFYTAEQRREIEAKGYFTIKNENRIRKEVMVDSQLATDIAEIDQKALFAEINCPILMIHGDQGEMEATLYPCSKDAIKLVSGDSTLVILEGSSHSFVEAYDKVIQLSIEWFSKHFD
ncbi:alpha/beta hydrolase [Fusibacter sp. Q10-2]|uniref:Alpha/beta hydrolase n=2 Tax=Fusibacter ferrireducens TaxID=2785058 RepID=A0ABR9ZRP4_9FIRM|nr:alpha/beta hydrolase [Fusibacter ferrireducens]